MKKLVLSVLLTGLFLIPTTNVSAQSAQTIDEQRETSHWSFGVRGGGTYFRVSPNAGDYVENMSWGLGGVLEYTINPLWGFGLSVDFLNFNRGDDMPGRTIDAGLFSSVNLLNLLSPNRTGWRRGGIYANVGGGVAFYNSEVVSRDLNVDGTGVFGMIGLGVEVPLGNTFALFGEGQYRSYTMVHDRLGGDPSFKNDAFLATLGLRMKINANRKDHVRNTRPVTPQEDIAMLMNELQRLQEQADRTALDVESLLNSMNNDIRQQERINRDLRNDIESLRRTVRDLDSKKANNAANTAMTNNIEFRFGSTTELTESSLTVLDQIAAELKADSNWTKLMLVGHTDNVGPIAVNKRISLERAETIKAHLVQRGVDTSKIETIGLGPEQPIASNDTREGRQQNRRVEFQLSR